MRDLQGLSCKHSAERHLKHAALIDIIKRGLQSAGVLSILKLVGVDRGVGKRTDGITVFLFFNGRNLCWDAICADTYADININSSAVSVGHAAREADE